VDGPFAFAAQHRGALGGGLVAFLVLEIAERAVDRAQAVGAGGNHHAGQRIVPHVAPVHAAGAVFGRVGQHRVIGVHAADDGGAGAGRGGIVGNAEMQRFIALGGCGNFTHVLHAERGLDDVLKADPLLVALRVFDLGDQHVDGVNIGRGAHLGDHDQVKAFACLFNDIDHIAVHVVGVEAVDSHRHGFVAPVDLVQGLDDVLAGLVFLVRRNRVFEIQEDHVNIRFCCFFKHLRLRAGDCQLAAVQAARGLFDGMKRHGCAPHSQWGFVLSSLGIPHEGVSCQEKSFHLNTFARERARASRARVRTRIRARVRGAAPRTRVIPQG